MSSLELFLLGPPRIERNGGPLELQYRKNVALLACLAVTGETHTREAVITLLWPELEPSRARAGLRRNLSVLRKALGEEWLAVDRETLGLSPRAAPSTGRRGELVEPSGQALWVDVDQFHSLLQAWRGHGHPQAEVCAECLTGLAEGVELYRGDFLEGFTLPDSPTFDEWQFFHTEELRQELASALERLIHGHIGQGEYERAIPYARRRLALDPLHEPAHQHLMQLYTQAGQRAAALRQYEECVRILEAEPGLPPSQETASLHEQIRAGAAGRAEPAVGQPRHNLPAQPTPFIGREAVLAEIREHLESPNCRLLTLVGPGGSGKTRLALEAAAAQLDHFEHGVVFVPLAPLRSAEAIVPTVAGAMNLSFYAAAGGAQAEPRQQLLDYLRQKQMLLVLDNFEHLLNDVGLVTQVLESAPEVKILATSRARLRVQGEHLFPVGGMDSPESPPEATSDAVVRQARDALRYSAVKLFLTGARRARPDFELTADNVADVVGICHLVAGMPLGVLLAAAWVGMLTPAEIAAQIGRSLDFLETDLRGVPERQRSMRATFDHSWQLLTEQEREVFQGLSGFRGGFSREAAQAVSGASLRELMGLVDKSLLRRMPAGRYEVHELLRQYGEEKLDESPGAGEAARDRHSAYYAGALERWARDLKGPRQQAALAEMEVEGENTRAAWDWAIDQGQVERLDRGAVSIL